SNGKTFHPRFPLITLICSDFPTPVFVYVLLSLCGSSVVLVLLLSLVLQITNHKSLAAIGFPLPQGGVRDVTQKSYSPDLANSTARTSALVLLSHSSYSLSGMESATIPAPAFT